MGQSSSGSGGGQSFSLVGGDQSELRQYANSQVEVRGMLESGGTGSGAAGAGGTGASSTGGSTAGSTGTGASSTGSGAMGSSSGSAQTLRVSSVRQIASSCSGGR